MVGVTATRFVRRPRAFVRVTGPDAEDLLQRLLSNDVGALAPNEACDALLLTPKARIVAPLRVHRCAADDFLLSTEPELGDTLRTHLLRARLRSRCELEREDHDAWLVLGGDEVLDDAPPGEEVGEEEAERARIEAAIPRWGRELDERVLPAEAGLTDTHVSFTKGCYPGQEPVARLHHRGHPNRTLRVFDLDGDELPEYDVEVVHDGKPVGRITSAARKAGAVVALGYLRTAVPADAELRVNERRVRVRALHA
jgi:folate-binding protein YgfZ